ncbi:MAG: VWA domain-containing protein [Phycisphaerae bacterium]|nr:VWA domain-containing protein [Phycisphaerae bacterium]
MSLFYKMQEMNKLLKAQICGIEFSKDISGMPLNPNPMRVYSATLLVFIIIDRSISMLESDYPPSRLKAAKRAAKDFVTTLKSHNDMAFVAVISFGETASVVLPPTSIEYEKQILKKINSIDIEGGTDTAKGLKEADSILSQYHNRSLKSQVILLTDGHGGRPTKVAEKLKFEYGTIIDVVGIGGNQKDVNEVLLKKVATTDVDGTNHYRFIKDQAALSQHYHQLATGLAWKGGC